MHRHSMGNCKEGHKFIGKKDSSGTHHTVGYRHSDVKQVGMSMNPPQNPSMSDGIKNESNSNDMNYEPIKGTHKPSSHKPYIIEKQSKHENHGNNFHG